MGGDADPAQSGPAGKQTKQGRAPGKGLTGQGRGIAVNRDTNQLSQAAAACPPWQTMPRSPFSLSGSDTQQRERARAPRVQSLSRPRPARDCPGDLAGSPRLSRAAVIGVTSHADATATPSAASGLTADAAHNRTRSAGSGKARPADLPALLAVSAPHSTPPGTAANASSQAPTDLRTTTNHLRTNGFGPEDHAAHVAAGPSNRTQTSDRKD